MKTAAVIVAIALLASVSYGSTIYSVTDLGDIFPEALNDSGQVVGSYHIDFTTISEAFLWDSGTLSNLNRGGQNQAFANDINNSGAVAGQIGRPGPWSAVSWNMSGTIADIDSLGQYSNAWGINNAGVVVGGIQDGPTGTSWARAFRWSSSDGLTMLDTNPASGSYGWAINENGTVAGELMNTACTWDVTGAYQPLGTLGGLFSMAYDINDAGWVVGYAEDIARTERPALWHDGTSQALVGGNGAAEAINNAGVAVGYSSSRAFLWEGGNAQYLDDIASVPGWKFDTAEDINENGWIVGRGTLNGEMRGYLLKPVPTPEPSTALLLVLGLPVVALRRRLNS